MPLFLTTFISFFWRNYFRGIVLFLILRRSPPFVAAGGHPIGVQLVEGEEVEVEVNFYQESETESESESEDEEDWSDLDLEGDVRLIRVISIYQKF